ncbi:hypothetical protein [Polymorphospora sp. NPDC050346]|uniref:hypothetical protein n=1 Tax=Polymorphospora sp. NPDC050346 TaxID=3155780 RepID=UPI0033DF5B6B
MSTFDEALDSRDWSGAEVETNESRGSVVHSTRMSRDLTERLFAEAERRGIRPSVLVREYVEAGLAAAAGSETVTIRLDVLHRAIDTAVKRDAA